MAKKSGDTAGVGISADGSSVRGDQPPKRAGGPAFFRNITRAASGGIAVGIALLLLLFLKSGGTGDGDAEERAAIEGDEMVAVDTNTAAGNETAAADRAASAAATDESPETGLTPDEQKALQGGVLGILIDENEYFLVIPGEVTVYRPTPLSRLVQLAGLAKGDTNGIRVRVLRRESARMKAEIDLKKALVDVGITEDAVYVPSELLSK